MFGKAEFNKDYDEKNYLPTEDTVTVMPPKLPLLLTPSVIAVCTSVGRVRAFFFSRTEI